MKILQVSNYFSPKYGGSAEVPFQHSKTLSQHGFHVTVFTSDLGLGETGGVIPGVVISAFSTWWKMAGFNITPGLIQKARRETGDFDVIHLHNYRTFQNVVVSYYARKHGIPYIVQAHGSIGTYFQKGLLKKVFDTFIGRRILKNAAKVLAVTPFEADQYLRMGVDKSRIEVVPHGIDLAEYDAPVDKSEFRKKYGLGTGQKIILFLGRINKIKGLDLFVEAFSMLLQKNKNIKLVIAGPDDGYLPALKRHVTELKLIDDVLFTGPLYNREKLAAYLSSDICVLPSSYEIFGITILEAWACGKPVITTDRCGLADAVREQGGLVVPYEKNALQQALTKLLADDDLCRELGRQGRAMVEERYSWLKVVLKLENIYQDVISKRTPQG
jgi:glycosyltransferase involved in cell wall biosynthesis